MHHGTQKQVLVFHVLRQIQGEACWLILYMKIFLGCLLYWYLKWEGGRTAQTVEAGMAPRGGAAVLNGGDAPSYEAWKLPMTAGWSFWEAQSISDWRLASGFGGRLLHG